MKNLFGIILLVFLSSHISAQGFGSKLKDKVLNTLENKTEQKVEEKINSTYDKTDQSVEDAVKGSGNKNSNKSQNSNYQEPQSEEDIYNMLNEMMGGSSVSFEEEDLSNVQPSKFIGSIKMNFETTQNGKVLKDESGDIHFFIDKFKVAFIPQFQETEESKIILDRQTAKMTILTTDKKGKKTGIAMKMPKINISDVEDFEDNSKVTVTNEKKTILGQSCTKIIVDDDDYYTVGWVTDDKDISMVELFNFMNVQTQQGKNNSKNDKYAGVSGITMEAATRDKKSGETTLVKVTEYKKGSVDSKAFSTSGYEVIDMSQMMNFGK